MEMASPKPRSSRSSSLRESHNPLSELSSERMDGTGSWDALEWTKIEPVSRSVSYDISEFLLEAEEVTAKANDIVAGSCKNDTREVPKKLYTFDQIPYMGDMRELGDYLHGIEDTNVHQLDKAVNILDALKKRKKARTTK